MIKKGYYSYADKYIIKFEENCNIDSISFYNGAYYHKVVIDDLKPIKESLAKFMLKMGYIQIENEVYCSII